MPDEPGVINIDDHRPHVHGHAMCLGCKREWMAVAPEGTAKIECPNCHSMEGRFLGDSRDCARCNYEKLVLRERAAMEQLDCQQWREQGLDLAKELDRLRTRAFDLAAENGEIKQRIAELEREREALMECFKAIDKDMHWGCASDEAHDAREVFLERPGALARWMSREAK